MDYEDIYNNQKFMKQLDDSQLDEFIAEAQLEYEMLANFDDFWADVEKYAEKVGVSTRYVEEEFILDGEFTPVELEWDLRQFENE